MSEIFISYRRNDSSAYTGRIADSLRNCFGKEYIFRDHETLDIGVKFKQDIQNHILSASIMLVVIGPNWEENDSETGKLRIENKDDFVRLEIEYALEHEITIIPLLVGGAEMPESSLLPEKMQKMGQFNAQHLTETHWDADIELLIEKLATETGLECKEKNSSLHWKSSLLPLLYVVPNFLSLLRSPKRFLRKHSFGRSKDLLNALIFFIAFILLAHIYLYNVWIPEGASFWNLVFLGIPLWLLVSVLISIPMWLSWWIVGARNHYQKTIVILLYQISIIVMIAYIGTTIMTTGLLSQGENKLQKAFQILNNPDVVDKSQSVMRVFEAAWSGSASFIFLGLGAGVLIALPIWLFVSWGSYRETFSKTIWASFFALPIFIIILTAPLFFLSWLGQGS